MEYLYQTNTDMSNVRKKIEILEYNMLDSYKRKVIKINQNCDSRIIFKISYQILN